MKTLADIVLLGDPRLYETCRPLLDDQSEEIYQIAKEMKEVVLQFQKKYGVGRAIAAPQLGYMYRLIYMNQPKEKVFINPRLHSFSEEMIELWDDCMSFPDLLVKVQRHQTCSITFFNLDWKEETWTVEDDLSELLQHEYDHLNGILCIDRAAGSNPFKWRMQK